VRETIVLPRRQARQDFNILAVVDLEVNKPCTAIFLIQPEGGLVAQELTIELVRLAEVAHLKGYMGDADNGRTVDR
jgi:hypothetical protein